MGVALPSDLEAVHRRALLAILLRAGGGLGEANVPVSGPVPLTCIGAGAAQTDSVRSVRPQCWTHPMRGWTMALPMVLDFFSKRNGRGIELDSPGPALALRLHQGHRGEPTGVAEAPPKAKEQVEYLASAM